MDNNLPQAPLSYLRNNLTLAGESFIKLWGGLAQQDKDDLLGYAREEMTVLGIAIK